MILIPIFYLIPKKDVMSTDLKDPPTNMIDPIPLIFFDKVVESTRRLVYKHMKNDPT